MDYWIGEESKVNLPSEINYSKPLHTHFHQESQEHLKDKQDKVSGENLMTDEDHDISISKKVGKLDE